MPDEPNPSSPSSSTTKSLLNHLLVMPKLHKKVLAVAVLLAGGGTVGQISAYMSPSSDVNQTLSVTTPANAPANSVVADGSSAQPALAPAADRSITERVSPVAQKLGFGFIAGFLIGWVFRAFIKIMSLITMVGVAIFAGLSYLNVDMSAIKTKFESGMGWATQQGEELADKAAKRLPGSAAGVTGLFFGFKRKK
jgi:uncharacterized membrane protein (Fun14 family)